MLGYFNDVQKEYVITEMKPRRPLDNYLWNEEFLANINHFGFGESFLRLPENNRRYLFFGGEATRLVYIKDKETGEIFNFKGYNEWSSPAALEGDSLTNQGISFDDNYCAALQFNIDLAAGEERVINVVVGLATGLDNAVEISDRFLKDGYFEANIARIKNECEQMDTVYTVATPDEYINSMTNTWLKRQISLGKTWGRIYSKGFRDIMQDVTALVSFGIDSAKEKIITCLEHQRFNGNPLRAFDPITLDLYYDGAAWIPATLLAYIKESGDASVLDIKCKYYDSDTEETVFEHMYRGLRFLLDNRGARNMVLWGGGDWNDSINNVGNRLKGESVWLSIATVKAITEFCELLEFIGGKDELIQSITEEKEVLKSAIMENAFEGDRFIYGINDWNEKVGSKESPEGKIYLNPQTWAVLADMLDREGCRKLMQTVEEELKCDYGYVQCSPAYTVKDTHIGRMAFFIPGGYENGSVYNHGVTFKIAADCKLGNNDAAFETLKLISYNNPANANSGVEPYAVTNMYLGPQEAYRKGFAPCSWITGTAGWLYRNITESILGITAEFNGIKINPCLPSVWDSVDISRIYRGATYNIAIRKTGEKKIVVDGAEQESNIIPVFEKGTLHTVEYCF